MKKTDVIIIGAGAAGLMAASLLSKSGKKVIVLEARNRIGGRIHTIMGDFSEVTELGAEFVHGNLPVTLQLLNEAGIGTTGVDFEMWHYRNNEFEQSYEFIQGFEVFLERLNMLEHDMPIAHFMEQYFSGDAHALMRTQIENYVAGYDTADSDIASAFALRNEWNHENEDEQHRITGGYGVLMNYLASVCTDAGNEIFLNAVARTINHTNNGVEIVTTTGDLYTAEKLIVALPLGVLQASENEEGAVLFNPPLPVQTQAFRNIGFGSVIKILLEFDTLFWENHIIHSRESDLSTMGFLFTDETIPTYWTQSPSRRPLLTGWLGGPPAFAIATMSNDDILDVTLKSLSAVFGIEIVKGNLTACEVANWHTEPFTRGSYAYDIVESPQARKTLQQPVNNTIYFAGEYLYEGAAMGTVEAALTSGRDVAERLLNEN
ncbi:flavin monoamine oxidase family protein [Flavobacterium sp. RHBU_3]|uniref:flavin monoamine oxidase family protein n=1 Tax=Flavobacterium sp. RHBU_3 TaxID=3391184 RepID=UPI003984CE11